MFQSNPNGLQIRFYDDYVHYVKSVRIRGYSGPHFPILGLNTERYGVFLHIQSECGKMRTRTTPNTGTFHAVFNIFYPLGNKTERYQHFI